LVHLKFTLAQIRVVVYTWIYRPFYILHNLYNLLVGIYHRKWKL
jgi:hypothetical protein